MPAKEGGRGGNLTPQSKRRSFVRPVCAKEGPDIGGLRTRRQMGRPIWDVEEERNFAFAAHEGEFCAILQLLVQLQSTERTPRRSRVQHQDVAAEGSERATSCNSSSSEAEDEAEAPLETTRGPLNTYWPLSFPLQVSFSSTQGHHHWVSNVRTYVQLLQLHGRVQR